MYYSKKPKEKFIPTVHLKSALVAPEQCRACGMELLAYKEEDDFYQPKEYCDSTCKRVFKTYEKNFLIGRAMATNAYFKAYYSKSTHGPLPNIDLRL
jgi:hypothetical protein